MPPPPIIPPPSPLHTLRMHPATPSAFSRFGTLIQNPGLASTSTSTITANQGTAAKHIQISPVISAYPSQSPQASQNLHMFSCAPRSLPPSGVFVCSILERHPYTSQTFIPLALSASPTADTYYVVIVAPTGDDGMPKLDELVAFRCRGDQAVTYAPGTWHAPMVAVGGRIDFCVLVAENGVQDEDLQEVLIGGEGVRVQVVDEQGNWGLWEK